MANLFYRNPRLLILAIALIVVAGLSSYTVLPRLEDPELTGRFALVTTLFPGASAERVESLVTEKIEDELDEIEEIELINSTSRAGISTIQIELLDTVYEVDEVWSRIRDKLDDAVPAMPAGVAPPEFDELEPRAYALVVALKWMQPGEVNFAILGRLSEELKDKIEGLAGTERVDEFAEPEEEVVVEVRPAEMAALGLTAEGIAAQVRASDAKVAAGQVRGRGGDLLMEVDAEIESIQRVARTPIQYGDSGGFVRLSDIAEVKKGIVEPRKAMAIVDGHEAVALAALVQSGHRLDRWSVEAQNALAEFSDALPRGVELRTIFLQSRYVENRLNGLMINLGLGAICVVGVILVMMGWRSAIVVGAALPFSVMMVFTGMRLIDMPLHQMSVTGLIIALGLLIDNAIVVVDEVQSRQQRGQSAAIAIAGTVKHLAVPLFGSTLTTALAFAPIVLMPGPAGEFVGPISLSVILAVFSSLFLSMTVVPALAGYLRGSSDPAGPNRWWQYGFSHVPSRAVYAKVLGFLFRRPLWGLAVGVSLPVIGFVQSRTLTEHFFPAADRDQFQIELELPSHGSLAQTQEAVLRARELILRHDEVSDVHWFIGESAPRFYYNVVKTRENASNYAEAMVQLHTLEGQRELINELQREMDQAFPGAIVLVRQLEQGPPFDAPIELRLYGPDWQRLRELGTAARAELASTPGIVLTRGDLSETLRKLALQVDEEEARLAGFDHLAIARQLDATLEGAVGGSLVESTEELPVRVRVAGSRRADLDTIASLELMPVRAPADVSRPYVPLDVLGDIRLVSEQSTISRRNSRRNITIQGFVTAGVLPAEVLTEFKRRLDERGVELPAGYYYEFGGETEQRDQAIGNLMSSVSVLLVMMAATLVLSFGSFRAAGIIALVAFLSIGLGLGALWLFGFAFGFMAIVGTMGLVGVAINDAIVVLAAIREHPEARRGANGRAVRSRGGIDTTCPGDDRDDGGRVHAFAHCRWAILAADGDGNRRRCCRRERCWR